MPTKRRKRFQPIPSPFGTGRNDEQATTDAMVDYVGGRVRAERLSQLRKNSYPMPGRWLGEQISAEEVFRRKALAEGFTAEEITAFLSV